MSDDWLTMDSKLSSTAYKVEVSFSPQLQCTIKHTHYMRPQKKKKRERNFPLKKNQVVLQKILKELISWMLFSSLQKPLVNAGGISALKLKATIYGNTQLLKSLSWHNISLSWDNTPMISCRNTRQWVEWEGKDKPTMDKSQRKVVV